MKSSTSHKIKQRDTPKDVFYTPLELVKKHISMIDYTDEDIWYDPFAGKSIYFNNYPKCSNKYWSEITEDRDFFNFKEDVDIICSNPPYSLIDDVLEYSVFLNPRIISYLIGINNLTPKRIEYMNRRGYGLVSMHICKVFKWYGMSVIVVFAKDYDNCISFDRKVWR